MFRVGREKAAQRINEPACRRGYWPKSERSKKPQREKTGAYDVQRQFPLQRSGDRNPGHCAYESRY
jgi:hypothetical protein